jgi:hypothetical protein
MVVDPRWSNSMRFAVSPFPRSVTANPDTPVGDEIGSVEIDLAFAKLASERLREAAPYIGLDHYSIPGLVKKMCKSSFKILKEEYGSEDSLHLAVRTIPIPDISGRTSSEVGNIQRGKLVLQM